jgi:hypothetical protein
MFYAVARLASVFLLLIILHDAFEVMLLPRRVKSRVRLVQFFFRFTWSVWSRLAGMFRTPDSRHNFASLFGPLSMISLLSVWATVLITAFGTLYWSWQPAGQALRPWRDEFYFSGVTFFTLGYGDIVPTTGIARTLSVLEAGVGLGFLATVIGYLPVLYQLFSRREAEVIKLDAVAGSPPCAVILLCRHSEHESVEELNNLLKDWQHWSAVLIESQLSYPMLAYYRSQHDNQSWLAALTTIMDVCALLMVGFQGVPTFRARLAFSTGRQAIIEMGRVFQVRARPFENHRLPAESFRKLASRLREANLLFAEESDAEQRLSSFRNTYEPFLNGLAHYLDLQLPDWLADEGQLDNWQNNPRGKTARRLIDAISANPE